MLKLRRLDRGRREKEDQKGNWITDLGKSLRNYWIGES